MWMYRTLLNIAGSHAVNVLCKCGEPPQESLMCVYRVPILLFLVQWCYCLNNRVQVSVFPVTRKAEGYRQPRVGSSLYYSCPCIPLFCRYLCCPSFSRRRTQIVYSHPIPFLSFSKPLSVSSFQGLSFGAIAFPLPHELISPSARMYCKSPQRWK